MKYVEGGLLTLSLNQVLLRTLLSQYLDFVAIRSLSSLTNRDDDCISLSIRCYRSMRIVGIEFATLHKDICRVLRKASASRHTQKKKRKRNLNTTLQRRLGSAS